MLQEYHNLRVRPDDEVYWRGIRDMFEPMYTNTQLVNTRRGPAPKSVRDEIRSMVNVALSYELDEYEPFSEMKESGSSLSTRRMLADYFGAWSDEMALTRNAMEGIATVLNGFDLRPGDEVLATQYCYDSNLAILRQRAAREGIILRIVELPFGRVSDEEILAVIESEMSEATRLISIPHVVQQTGLIFPVKRITELARPRGIFTFVDGAHSAGHIELSLQDLGCDAFAACLHKWMFGPRGSGFLYVRREQISNIWPLFASWSGKPADCIEKFEEVGTVFKAPLAAMPEAMAFNRGIGQAEKAARFTFLRNRWASRLRSHGRVQLLTDIDSTPGTGFGAFVIDGMDSFKFADILLNNFDIHVKAFVMETNVALNGIHISPSLTNSIEEIDKFVEATLSILDSYSIGLDAGTRSQSMDAQ